MCTLTLRCCLVIACVMLVGCKPARKSDEFETIRALVLSGQYDEAGASLEAYIAERPRGKHASRAGLFLFKANFAKREYAKAKKWCDWTIENYPDSLEARKCEFKIGLVLMAQENLGSALKQFEAVVSSNRNPLRPEAAYFVDYLKAKIADGDQAQLVEALQP